MNEKTMNQNELKDTWKASGTDRFDLAHTVGRVANSTNSYCLEGKNLTWWVVTSNGVDEVLKACPANPMTQGTGKTITLAALTAKGSPVHDWSAELQDESFNVSKILVSFTDENGKLKMLAVSPNIPRDFANLGITGSAAWRASYHLLGLVAEQIENEDITLVTRVADDKDGTVEKVIALRSGRFAPIPQDDALALASTVCADGDIVYWNVNHFLTEVVYEFPQAAVKMRYGSKDAELIPYIRYFTSDTGDSSCSFELGWNVNSRHKIFLASGDHRAARTHRGEWDSNTRSSLEKRARKLKDKFTIVQQKLDELSRVTVLNANLERCVRNLCSDVQIKTKSSVEGLVRHVTTEFASRDVSAAEIILSMIEAQDTECELIDLSDGQRDKLAHTMGELLYQRIRQYA